MTILYLNRVFLFVLPSENHPFKSGTSSLMLNNLSSIVSLWLVFNPFRDLKGNEILPEYRKYKDIASKTHIIDGDSWLPGESPILLLILGFGTSVFSFLAQNHLKDLMWSRNYEGLDYLVLAEVSNQLSCIHLSFFWTVFCL